MTEPGAQNSSQLLIYQSEDGVTRLEVQLQDETVWLSQKHMAELFQTSKQSIGQHLKNIFAEEELDEKAVVKNFFTTAADGKKYQTNFYNLDGIISVGYRIKSHVTTRFRQGPPSTSASLLSKARNQTIKEEVAAQSAVTH
ncbi:MAG: RhuM family protein [Thermodesulfobacteriota bacterium]|nr:RhuM family protein [Thermodesulfobacteriota bacterium]